MERVRFAGLFTGKYESLNLHTLTNWYISKEYERVFVMCRFAGSLLVVTSSYVGYTVEYPQIDREILHILQAGSLK